MMFENILGVEPYSIFETVKVSLSIFMLAYTSFLDIKYREIEPRIWLLFGAILGTITSYQLYLLMVSLDGAYAFTLLIYAITSIGLTSVLAFSFAYFELMGGADFFAILVLSIAHPWSPTSRLVEVIPFFPISLLANSTFIALTPAIYNFGYNLLKKNWRLLDSLEGESYKKIALMFTGRPMKASRFLKTKFTYLAEDISVRCGKRGRVRFGFKVSEDPDKDRVQVRTALEKNVITPEEQLWTTEGLPMVAFILAGYITTITLGDLVMYIVLVALSSIGIINL